MSLSDLVRKPGPSTPAAIIEGGNGMQAQSVRCEKHGTEFTRIWIPTYECWQGSCPDCKRDQELEAKAHELLRTVEYRQRLGVRVNARVAEQDGDLPQKARELAQARVRELIPSIEADLRSDLRGRIQGEVESEMLAEIVKQLREESACQN